MADVKISDLPSAASISSTDIVPVVTSGATKKVTANALLNGALSGGTANGVLYLNGSKVATSGSALTFDGTNFTSTRTQITTAGTPPASGAGIELVGGTTPVLLTYNRGTAAYLPLTTSASAHSWTLSGSDAMVLTSTGLGIGTSSPGEKLDVRSSSNAIGNFQSSNASSYAGINAINGSRSWYAGIRADASNGFGIRDETAGATRLLIDSSGNLLVGTTSANGVIANGLNVINTSGATTVSIGHANGTGGGSTYLNFSYNNGSIGSITQNGTTGVLYNTSSDYRLKNITSELTGYKERIMALQPKQGTWKADGSEFRGFLAHEFAEQYSASVIGEKDAIDEEGNPIMQAMQASSPEVIADLVAYIHNLETRLAALEGK